MKQYPLPLPVLDSMQADDFRVTDSNREAVAWIDTWPSWSSPCVVIHGLSGSGKTHLAQVFLARSLGQFLTLDQLVTQPAATWVEENKTILIDNAETCAGDAAKEEALFHLFNVVRDAKGFLFLTAKNAPAQWNMRLPDLRSRLCSVPAIGLAAPDDELLSALLIKQFRDRQLDIGSDVIKYLLPRIERSPAALRSLVTAIDRASLAERRGITVALARQVLEAEQPFPPL